MSLKRQMELYEYLKTLSDEEKKIFARKAHTSTHYLYMVATGRRKAGAKMIRNIPAASNGAITVEDLL